MNVESPTVKTWSFEDIHRIKQQLKDEGKRETLAYICALEESETGLKRTVALALEKIHQLSDKSGTNKG